MQWVWTICNAKNTRSIGCFSQWTFNRITTLNIKFALLVKMNSWGVLDIATDFPAGVWYRPWIDHLPVVAWSRLWQSSYERQLVCKFGTINSDVNYHIHIMCSICSIRLIFYLWCSNLFCQILCRRVVIMLPERGSPQYQISRTTMLREKRIDCYLLTSLLVRDIQPW